MLDKTNVTEPEAPAGFAKEQLLQFVERAERLDEEIKALNADKRDLYAEAKGVGFDVPALKAIVKIRKQDADERQEHNAMVELYAQTLGIRL